jgi:hypothetical protein
MGDLTEKQIRNLEIKVRDRYQGNPDTTERAYDEKYVRMLETLKTAYQIRNASRVKDQLGWTTSDARRVQLYQEVLDKLADERRAVAEYLLEDPFR